MALPTSGLVLWNEARAITGLVHGDPCATLPGLGGKQSLVQATGAAKPEYRVMGGQPEVYFDGVDDELAGSASATFKHVFINCRYDSATFLTYAGLFMGTAGTTYMRGFDGYAQFFQYDQDGSATVYRLDGVDHPYPLFTAPMQVYAVVEMAIPSGKTFTPLIGNDNNAGGRFWKGSVRAIAAYDRVLTGTDQADALAYMALAAQEQTFNFAQAAEVETAQPLAALVKTAAMVQALEADTAQALAASGQVALAQAAETDTAWPLAALKRPDTAQALEIDAALAMTVLDDAPAAAGAGAGRIVRSGTGRILTGTTGRI